MCRFVFQKIFEEEPMGSHSFLSRIRLAPWLALAAATYACSSSTAPVCGNDVVEFGEECDSSNHDFCTDQCRFAKCGDGVVQKGEDCDDYGRNTDKCTSECKTARCGDGI